jgi:hypothetical protein
VRYDASIDFHEHHEAHEENSRLARSAPFVVFVSFVIFVNLCFLPEAPMIKLTGKGSAQTCDGVTRRDFVQAGALGMIGLTLPQLLAAQARGAVAKNHDERSVIMIFNLGAPSQQDLFDPKPDQPEEIRGPFKTIKTASKDIQLTELLPLHAKIADKFSLVRSCYPPPPPCMTPGIR